MTHVLDPDALPDDARALTVPMPPYSDVTRSDASFRAFLHGLPGVDQVGAESRVAMSIAQAFAVVLIDRVPSTATRDSAPTWSTPGRPCRKARKAESERVTSSYGGSGAINARASSGSASGSNRWVMRSLSSS